MGRRPAGFGISGEAARTRSLADGTFTLRARADLTGDMRAQVNDAFALLEPVPAVEWGASGAVLRVRRRPPSPSPSPSPAATVELRVADADSGGPVERFGYFLHPPQPPNGFARTGTLSHGGNHPGGVLATQDIPAGRYHLQVFPAWTHESAYQDIEVSATGHVVVRVAVAPVTFADLAVHVEDRMGNPLAHAEVEVIKCCHVRSSIATAW